MPSSSSSSFALLRPFRIVRHRRTRLWHVRRNGKSASRQVVTQRVRVRRRHAKCSIRKRRALGEAIGGQLSLCAKRCHEDAKLGSWLRCLTPSCDKCKKCIALHFIYLFFCFWHFKSGSDANVQLTHRHTPFYSSTESDFLEPAKKSIPQVPFFEHECAENRLSASFLSVKFGFVTNTFL